MALEAIEIGSGRLKTPRPDAAGVRSFKGVPYAAAPLGPLRWRPPQPPPSWSGVRPTHGFGPGSLQAALFGDIDPALAGVSEDCLYLNVWTPANLSAGERLPVMVWIHGGGFAAGSGSEPRYDGARLAAKGIVVVTVNHRLNALGFLAHPELSAESETGSSGDYGMLDLVAALRWVGVNIAAFGGDPKAVTIAGESAGSMAVSGLMASPLAKGLFIRAIGESGSLFDSPTRRLSPLAEAEIGGLAFARRLGVATLAELRALRADAILAAAPGVGFWPIVDGHFLPRAPDEIYRDRAHSDVALMAGWNKDEGFNFTLQQGDNAAKTYAEIVRAVFPRDADAALALYPGGDAARDAAAARQLGGDLMINHSTWGWLEAQRACGRAEVFRFRFDRAPLTPQGWFGERPSRDAGAFHAGEIPYDFDNHDATPWAIAPEDRAIAATASSYWINFVKTGDPNGAGLTRWPSYRSEERPVMRIDEPPRAEAESARARMEFLDRVAKRVSD
jgi:para-nitrobenzyl esterase